MKRVSARSLALTAAAVFSLAACGGKAKSEDTTAAGDDPGASATGGTVVGPETMDEIRRALDRKRNVVARCLAPAIDASELPKNARGRMTLGFVISPAGKAGSIKIIKSSLDSRMLTDCVIGHVEEIEFPQVPDPLPWSYTYGFEAM